MNTQHSLGLVTNCHESNANLNKFARIDTPQANQTLYKCVSKTWTKWDESSDTLIDKCDT